MLNRLLGEINTKEVDRGLLCFQASLALGDEFLAKLGCSVMKTSHWSHEQHLVTSSQL